MKLGAVIVHFSNPEQTTRLLQRLISDDQVEKVVVVLHGPYPDRVSDSKIEYVESQNRGFGAGLNVAVRYLQNGVELILALNPDVQLGNTQIGELIAEHFRSEADCTFPTIVEGNITIHGYDFSRFGSIRLVAHSPAFYPATCFLISTGAWQRTNGFNEEYFHYFEDADFCDRLKKARCKIHHAAGIAIRHIGKSGIDYPATELPRYAVRNHLLFLSRSGRMNLLTFWNVALRQFLYLFRWKRPWRGFRQWWAGLQEFRAIAK